MTVLGVRFRAELRAHWRRWLGLAMVVGIAAGAVIALAAGARRTDSAYPRFLRAHRAYDVVIINYEEDGSAVYDFEEIADLPMVSEVARGAFDYLPFGGAGGTPGIATYDDRFGHDINQFKVLDGRLADPKRADEVVIGFQVADANDLRVGSRVDSVPPRVVDLVEANDLERLQELAGVPVSAEEFAGFRRFLDEVPAGQVHVVGIVATPGEVPPAYQGGVSCCVHLTPTFAEVAGWTNEALAVRLHGGASAVPTFVDELERRGEGLQPQLVIQDESAAGVERAIDVQVVALLLAGLVAVAGALILLQLLARFETLESADDATLAALGMSVSQRFAMSLTRAAAVGVGGAVIAVGVAVAASRFFPTGTARIVEADPGVAVDGVALAIGAALTALVVVLLATVPAWRATRRSSISSRDAENAHDTAAVRRLPNLRPTAAVGVRIALQRGRGRTTVPVGTSLAASVVGIAVVVGALTFSSNLDHLLGTPRLYGVGWDIAVWNGGGGRPVAGPLAPIAESYEGVVGVATGGDSARVDVGGHTIEIAGFDRRVGDVVPPVVDGRPPSSFGEVALGATTMRDLGVEIGDTIEALTFDGHEERLHVVGRAVLPTMGGELQLGTGGYATTATAQRLEGQPAEDVASGALFLALEPGTDDEEVFAALQAEVCTDEDLVCELFRLPIDDPADLVNFGRVRSTPLILAGVLAVLAAGTMAHVMVTAIQQRRRDLALLQVLGFTHRQVRSAIAVQASTFVAVTLLVAVPLGIAAGSLLWRLRAGDLGIVNERQIPWSAVTLVVILTLACANLIVILPARAAARTGRLGPALRSE